MFPDPLAKHPRLKALALALLFGALGAAAGRSQLVAHWDDQILDRFFLLRGARPPRLPLVLIYLDEPTLDYIKATRHRAELTRNDLAEAFEKMKAAGAKTIAGDFTLNGPSLQPSSESGLLRRLPDLRGAVVNSVYVSKIVEGREREVYQPPAEPYATYFDAGFANISDDEDRVVRRVQLAREIDGRRYFSFALAIAAAFRGETPQQVLDSLPKAGRLPGGDSWIRVNYAGPEGTFPHVSLYEILQNSDFANRALVSGKIALAGNSLPSAKNSLGTPFSAPGEDYLLGPELHANAVATIIDGGIANAPFLLQWAWGALLALLVITVGNRLTQQQSLALVPAALGAATAASYLLFSLRSVWFGCVPGALAIVAACGPVFARVAETVVRPAPNLHGVALLVVDMCDSTSLSNKYGDALATRMKDSLREIVLSAARARGLKFYKGTGDGLLLVFPDAVAALRSSWIFLEALAERNALASPKEAIDVRCALHVGEVNLVVVGRHKDIEGEAANFVCRLEGLKGENLIEDAGGMKPDELPAKNRMLMSEAAHEDIQGNPEFPSRYIGFFDLKGIRGRHRIYQALRPGRA